jgi:drug/metabolite transporter (DMT)-like permease
MYVGVHTPADVLTGALCAILLVVSLKPLAFRGDGKTLKLLLGAMVALAMVFLLYVELWPFPADMDAHNLQSGYKNAYTMIGCLTAVAIVYAADRKWLDFPVDAVWWVQIIKVILGLALVLAVKELTRAPLDAIFGGHMIARGIRYFLIVIVAGILWPMSFRRLSKLGKK